MKYEELRCFVIGDWMEAAKSYSLPKLRFGYKDLEPNISEEQLTIHHDKHHLAYVNGANAVLEKMDKARKEGVDFDVKSTLKELSFHIGGHLLHSLFWDNMAPTGKGGDAPGGYLGDEVGREFGSFDRFKKEFSQAANSVEGSGWAALAYCRQTKRPIIMQIEKHNANVYPAFKILMVLDVWEHAYYIDYRNQRAKFVDAFWNIVNWNTVNRRLDEVMRQDPVDATMHE
jgi:Fe-Mn family superoxide dismutase